MLKRIKVRGKLLLLLATPLVAVLVFAYSGIVDRTESTEFQEGEARIAELADAGSDLSLAIRVERLRVLEAAANLRSRSIWTRNNLLRITRRGFEKLRGCCD